MAIRFLDPEVPPQGRSKIRFLDEQPQPSQPSMLATAGKSVASAIGGMIPGGAGVQAALKVGNYAKNNPEESLGYLPAIGSTIGGVLGAPAAPVTFGTSAIGGAALGGAAGKAFEQLGRRALGAPVPETPMAAAKDIGYEGAKQGAYEALGLGIGKAIPAAFKVGKKLGGIVADSVPGIKKGTGALAAEFPEITKKGYASKERLEEFGKTLVDKIQGYQTATKSTFAKTAENIDKAEGAGRIPVKNLVADFTAFKKEYGVGKKGLQKLDSRTQNVFSEVEKELAEEVQGKEVFDLRDMLRLRQRVKREVDFAATEAGKGLDQAALKNLYSSIDDRIAKDNVYKTFKGMDADYEDMIATTKDLKTAFGLPAKDLDDFSLAEKKALEAKVMQSLGKGEFEEEALHLLDRKLQPGKNTLQEAQKLAAAPQFGKYMPNTFGKLSIPAALATIPFHPLVGGAMLAAGAGTSPAAIGAMLRGGKALSKMSKDVIPAISPAIKGLGAITGLPKKRNKHAK